MHWYMITSDTKMFKKGQYDSYIWPTYIIQQAIRTHGIDYAVLTHVPLEKMASFSQTTFSNVFSWMKIVELWSVLEIPAGLSARGRQLLHRTGNSFD